MEKELTAAEIIEKLKWFHGGDFWKYPLSENLQDNINQGIPALAHAY